MARLGNLASSSTTAPAQKEKDPINKLIFIIASRTSTYRQGFLAMNAFLAFPGIISLKFQRAIDKISGIDGKKTIGSAPQQEVLNCACRLM